MRARYTLERDVNETAVTWRSTLTPESNVRIKWPRSCLYRLADAIKWMVIRFINVQRCATDPSSSAFSPLSREWKVWNEISTLIYSVLQKLITKFAVDCEIRYYLDKFALKRQILRLRSIISQRDRRDIKGYWNQSDRFPSVRIFMTIRAKCHLKLSDYIENQLNRYLYQREYDSSSCNIMFSEQTLKQNLSLAIFVYCLTVLGHREFFKFTTQMQKNPFQRPGRPIEKLIWPSLIVRAKLREYVA